MITNLKTGTVLAKDFTVKHIRKKHVMSEMSNPIVSATVAELTCPYVSTAFLEFYTYLNNPPPFQQWVPIVEEDLENARIFPMWKPSQIKQQCICLPYKIRTASGKILAVTQMLVAKNKTVIASKLWWFGSPRINKFFVGFRSGMKERTEELLLAGLLLTD